MLLTSNFQQNHYVWVWSTQIIIKKVFSSFPENNLVFSLEYLMGNIGDLQSLCDGLTIFPANPAQSTTQDPPWSSYYRLTVSPAPPPPPAPPPRPPPPPAPITQKIWSLFEQLRLRWRLWWFDWWCGVAWWCGGVWRGGVFTLLYFPNFSSPLPTVTSWQLHFQPKFSILSAERGERTNRIKFPNSIC